MKFPKNNFATSDLSRRVHKLFYVPRLEPMLGRQLGWYVVIIKIRLTSIVRKSASRWRITRKTTRRSWCPFFTGWACTSITPDRPAVWTCRRRSRTIQWTDGVIRWVQPCSGTCNHSVEWVNKYIIWRNI